MGRIGASLEARPNAPMTVCAPTSGQPRRAAVGALAAAGAASAPILGTARSFGRIPPAEFSQNLSRRARGNALNLIAGAGASGHRIATRRQRTMRPPPLRLVPGDADPSLEPPSTPPHDPAAPLFKPAEAPTGRSRGAEHAVEVPATRSTRPSTLSPTVSTPSVRRSMPSSTPHELAAAPFDALDPLGEALPVAVVALDALRDAAPSS